MTTALMGQKTIYTGAAVPATPYDGQIWICTSSNPSLAKVYDATNTRWMEHHETRYETVASGQLPISGIYLNGTLCVAYDTQQSGTKLYAYANSSWRDMGGTLVRAYPFGKISSTETLTGATNDAFGVNIHVSGGHPIGTTFTLLSGNITPTTSGCTIAVFLGGVITHQFGAHRSTLNLKVGDAIVATTTVSGGWNTYTLVGFVNGAPNTSTNICAQVTLLTSGQPWYGPLSLAALSVET